MDDIFDGTIVLEQLNYIGRLEEFFDAIDADDFDRADALLRKAAVDDETIEIVLKKMRDADGDH